jgi:hypothetical protein
MLIKKAIMRVLELALSFLRYVTTLPQHATKRGR